MSMAYTSHCSLAINTFFTGSMKLLDAPVVPTGTQNRLSTEIEKPNLNTLKLFYAARYGPV